MFVEYLLNLKGPVLREYFPGDVTPAGAKYQFSKKFKDVDYTILTVGYNWKMHETSWKPDPSWPVILFPKRKRKLAFGRYVD